MIKVGDSLELVPKYSIEAEKYRSMVVEIQGNNLFIDYPVNVATGKIVFLTEGSQMKVTFVGNEDAVYTFDTEVLGRIKSNIPMIKLFNPDMDTYMKIQRRQYKRIDSQVDVAVHSEGYEFRPFTTVTADISAGGASIRVPKTFTVVPNDNLNLWLIIPSDSGESKYLRLKSNYVRTAKEENNLNYLKWSLQFSNPSQADRQCIIRYIFETQLEMKKKGLEFN